MGQRMVTAVASLDAVVRAVSGAVTAAGADVKANVIITKAVAAVVAFVGLSCNITCCSLFHVVEYVGSECLSRIKCCSLFHAVEFVDSECSSRVTGYVNFLDT